MKRVLCVITTDFAMGANGCNDELLPDLMV